MSRLDRKPRRSVAAGAFALLLLAAALAGCGGSSGSSSSTSAGTAKGARVQFAKRSAALRSCLRKSGITLPNVKPGQPGGAFGGVRGGAPQLPKGVTRAQLQAALKKCGAGSFRRGGRAFDTTASKQRFARFAACMRKNGVNLPAPNTSGKGPVFDTKGIDTSGARFKAADAKCVRELAPAGAGGPGAGGPGGAGGAAPGAAQTGQAGPPPGQ